MSSIEVLHNGIAESLDSSEFSLIPDPNEAVGGFNGNFQLDMSSILQTATQDLSIEDIQKRLVELVEDNESMKKALKLNNTMMREQLSTITEWHNQMTTSMSKQQINLGEAKEKILILENENAELRHRVKEANENSTNVTDTETCTDDFNTMTSFEEVGMDFVSTKCFKDEESLRNELKSANDRIKEMKESLDMQTLKISEMQKSMEEKDESLVLCNQKKQLLKDLSENLKKKIEDFKNEMHQMRITDEARMKLLDKTVMGLEETLLNEKREHDAESARHLETKKTLHILQVNYDSAVKSLEKFSFDNKDFKGKHLERIDELVAKTFDMNQTIERYKEDIKKKEEALAILKEETEAIPILKAQVEEYKAELDNALLSKESSVQEVQRLKKDLDFFHAAISSNTDEAFQAVPPSDNQPENPTSGFVCPLCGFGFDNLQAAENHVNDCLDNSPP